jgi:hypothetical protein
MGRQRVIHHRQWDLAAKEEIEHWTPQPDKGRLGSWLFWCTPDSVGTMCGRERAGLILLLAAMLPGALRAQESGSILPSPALVLTGGVVSADLSSEAPTSDGTVFGLRLDFPLASWIVLEPSIERLSLDVGDDTSVRWQLDFGLWGELPVGAIRPYVGAALGALVWPGDQRPPEEDFVIATYGGMAGLLYDVTDRVGLRGEARMRWLDGLKTKTTTFDAGLSWRF